MITNRQGQSSTVRKGLHIPGREIDATGSYPCALAETIFFQAVPASGFVPISPRAILPVGRYPVLQHLSFRAFKKMTFSRFARIPPTRGIRCFVNYFKFYLCIFSPCPAGCNIIFYERKNTDHTPHVY